MSDVLVPGVNTEIVTADGVPVAGFVAPGFEPVRDAFADNFGIELDALNAMLHGPGRAETGAAISLFHQGHKVVDLWGGFVGGKQRDTPPTPYPSDALQLVFSTTKGVTAICANLLVQRGLIDLDAPVADYWPEFAAAGKGAIPVRYLLSHRSGLPWTDHPMTMADALRWEPVVEALALQAPHWEPGTKHGYHATTFGWLVGEVIRRVTGKSVGQVVQEELAGPLGLHLWIGLPAAQHHRVVPLEVIELPDDPALAPLVDMVVGPDIPLGKALFAPGDAWREHNFGSFNLPEVWAAEIPAANCITDARSLAKLYAATVSDVEAADGTTAPRLFTEATLESATTVQTSGTDLVLMDMDVQYGLGFNVPSAALKLGGPRSFGHYGAGGSLGFADPDAELGFAYVMNKMYLGMSGDPRSSRLIDAAYECLGS